MPATRPDTSPAVYRALALANVRYWTTVHRRVRAELRHWERQAAAIPDPTWRTIALDKLESEHFNAQVAATLATLAPHHLRPTVVRAIVAAEVLYDYLDGASEQTAPHGGANLYAAFATALGHERFETAHYYADLTTDDGGYVQRLALTWHNALCQLPAAAHVHKAARRAADRCATAQTLTHRLPADGIESLRRWSETNASRHHLAWWEYAAGGAASILSVHALIAAAADTGTTAADADAIDDAYLLACALSTLLDSLVDCERDVAEGAHSFIAYYADERQQTDGVSAVARRAITAASRLRDAPHHVMTVVGVAGYYLSAGGATTSRARPTAAAVRSQLGPVANPILSIFAMWRTAKTARNGQEKQAHTTSLLPV